MKKTQQSLKRKEYDRQFEDLVKEYLPYSNSLNNLCENIGKKSAGAYYDKIKKIIEKNNLSTEHFGTIPFLNNGKKRNITDENFFVENSRRGSKCIIQRIVDNGIKKYECEICGISEWNGKPLRLQVHHINGNHYDNRLMNLQLLCPNCHTQTDTYAGKNITKNEKLPKNIEKIKADIIYTRSKEKEHLCKFCGKHIDGAGEKYCSVECAKKAATRFEVTSNELLADFKELKSYKLVGLKYGVSDNAIKKRTKKLGIFEEIQQYITHRGKYK